MNWNNVDWDNFSCVDMQRQIRSKIAEERANMSIVEYLKGKRASQNDLENSENLASTAYSSVMNENCIET